MNICSSTPVNSTGLRPHSFKNASIPEVAETTAVNLQAAFLFQTECYCTIPTTSWRLNKLYSSAISSPDSSTYCVVQEDPDMTNAEILVEAGATVHIVAKNSVSVRRCGYGNALFLHVAIAAVW